MAVFINNIRIITPEFLENYRPEECESEAYIVTSSAEDYILKSSAARKIIQTFCPYDLKENPSFISIACLGFFACILEFEKSGADSATVLLLETPSGYVQSVLDRAGVGVGGDGFVAEEISCLVDLGRQPKPGAFTVDYCTILSGAASLGSTSRLVSQLASLYGKLLGARPDARCVTFENASRWSGYVAQLFFSTLAHNDVPTFSWLESVEQGARHYMTARPALDLIANEAFAHERPLLLSALGAGGRIGVLMLVPQHYESVQDLPIGLSHDFGQAEIVTHGHMEDIVHYVQKKYYGRTNFYFKWGIANVVGRVETEDFEYTAPLSSALP